MYGTPRFGRCCAISTDRGSDRVGYRGTPFLPTRSLPRSVLMACAGGTDPNTASASWRASHRVRVALVDAGGANLGSVRYALERLGAVVEIVRDAAALRRADRVVLPGVGAAAPAMARLETLGLVDAIRALEVPLLGICLGMQLLYDESDEGSVACLGILPGRVERLAGGHRLRVPHMGWNAVSAVRDSPLLDGMARDSRAYFVHGYAAPISPDTVATCTHGRPFAAVAENGRTFGVQFHPERSGAVGARLLRNFLDVEAS